MLVPPPGSDLQLLDRDEAAKVLPDLFERQRRGRPGEVSRSDGFWEEYFADTPGSHRHRGSPLFYAVGADGYVAYRAVEEPGEWGRARIVVEELRGTTPGAEAALWAFVLGVDLVDRITVLRRPVDEPMRWRLTDPRQLRVTAVEDRLHLRILDLPAAIAARAWRVPGRLVVDVTPAAQPVGGPDPVPGRWVIDAGPDGADCRPAGSGEAPDLALDVSALGSLYLGGYPASLLAAAGRVEELTAGALQSADRLFTTTPAPLTGTGF
jgi:predicted acetyltransferase